MLTIYGLLSKFQWSHLSRRFRNNSYWWRMHKRRREHQWEVNKSRKRTLHTLEQHRNIDQITNLMQQHALVQHQAPVQQSAPVQPSALVQYPTPVQHPAPVQRRNNKRHPNPEEYEYDTEEEIYKYLMLLQGYVICASVLAVSICLLVAFEKISASSNPRSEIIAETIRKNTKTMVGVSGSCLLLYGEYYGLIRVGVPLDIAKLLCHVVVRICGIIALAAYVNLRWSTTYYWAINIVFFIIPGFYANFQWIWWKYQHRR